MQQIRLQGGGDGQAAFSAGLKGLVDKDLKLWMVTSARYALVSPFQVLLHSVVHCSSEATFCLFLWSDFSCLMQHGGLGIEMLHLLLVPSSFALNGCALVSRGVSVPLLTCCCCPSVFSKQQACGLFHSCESSQQLPYSCRWTPAGLSPRAGVGRQKGRQGGCPHQAAQYSEGRGGQAPATAEAPVIRPAHQLDDRQGHVDHARRRGAVCGGRDQQHGGYPLAAAFAGSVLVGAVCVSSEHLRCSPYVDRQCFVSSTSAAPITMT